MTQEHASLALPGREPGCQSRERFAHSTLQFLYHYRDLLAAETGDAFFLIDPVSQAVDAGNAAAYKQAVQTTLYQDHLFETGTNELLYRTIHKLRLQKFGADAICNALPGELPQAGSGIDQHALWRPVWDICDTVAIQLTDRRYLPHCRADVQQAQKAGKQVFLLCSAAPDGIIPTAEEFAALMGGSNVTYLPVQDCFGCLDPAQVPCTAALEQAITNGTACLLGYGEDALCEAHSLRLPAFIQVVPESLYCRALTNLFSQTLFCKIYVPRGFSILPYVPVNERSTMTYYHLAALAEKFGSGIYQKPLQELYALAPGLFANFYDDHLPARTAPDFAWDGTGDYWQARDAYYDHTLDQPGDFHYFHACCDCKTGTPLPFHWGQEASQDAVLVHGVCVKPGHEVTVFQQQGGAVSPREYWFDAQGAALDGVVSNFSFFMTDNLQQQFNALRADRPQEQLHRAVGHIDYRLTYDADGRRRESFPLYNKACLAKKRHGGYLEFPFRLGAGKLQLNGCTLPWEAAQVDSAQPDADILVYTPYGSLPDEEQSNATYRKEVGAGRLNLVFVGDSLLCVRRGSVLLPCIGVVVSVGGVPAKILQQTLDEPDSQGYYPCDDVPVRITLAPPAGITPEEWADVEWAYGGGLTLVRDGESLTEENYLAQLRQEGWLSPLSRQTQESAVHVMMRHPRTVVGITADGSICMLVFSGRTRYSCGADYLEVCRIARQLVPELRYLINWDGGASSVLGWVQGQEFTELSYAAPSDRSCAGMARRINSMLYIARKK